MYNLGCTSQEITKLLPKPEERKRYSKRSLNTESTQIAKKARLETQPANDGLEKQQKAALEANEKYIIDGLTLEKAVSLIVTGLNKVPAAMPNFFSDEYAVFVQSGQVGQTKIIAKLLAKQFLDADLGPGAKLITKTAEKLLEEVTIKIEADDTKDEKVSKISGKQMFYKGQIFSNLRLRKNVKLQNNQGP